jgi:hypothetical protein
MPVYASYNHAYTKCHDNDIVFRHICYIILGYYLYSCACLSYWIVMERDIGLLWREILDCYGERYWIVMERDIGLLWREILAKITCYMVI